MKMRHIIIPLFLFIIPNNISGISPADTNQLAEKVYLHIDRIQYTSGDDIWFKAFVIDPSTNKLSPNTNNLHVELISPDEQITLCRVIRIDKGTGFGDFSLDDSIPSGRYRIRAYTNHMRNYGEQFFFIKEISIINPFDNAENLEPPKQKIENKIDVNYFPEGGSLVDNVTSTVAFKAINALGKGCDVTVKLHASPRELITVFNSTHLGMGFFNLKPIPGNSYYTVVQGKDGTEIQAPLPHSFPTGVAIRTLVTPDKKLILTVNTNEATLPILIGKELSVDISSRNLVNTTTKVKVDSIVTNFLIQLDSIPDGIMRVTLSVPDGLPLCERLVFLQKNDDVRLNISTDKNEYKSREKVIAEITLSGDSTFTGAGEYSLSAAEERFTENTSAYPRSIASWFLLESDVRGPVENPSYYFNPENKKRFQDLDLLLMTQGWRDFKWKYDSLSSFKNEIGFTISGNVKRILNNKSVEGIKINLGLFSANSTGFLDTKTDKNGKFRFDELDIYGKTRAFVSSTGKFENMQGIITVDSLKDYPPEIEMMKSNAVEYEIRSKNISSYRQEALIKLNTLKKYRLKDTIMVGEVTIAAEKITTPVEERVKESRKIYATPDKEYIVPITAENYAGDVFSYISGRIAGVRVVRGVDKSSIYYPDDAQVYIRGQFITHNGVRQGALILLDGYEVDNSGLIKILSLPMNIIDRIDVLTASSLYGFRGANGVINIITKTGLRRDPVKLAPNSIYTSIHSFDIPRIFYSPKYDNNADQTITPDFRSTIFWQPYIKVEKNKSAKFEYYNADRPTMINITVEGITQEGIPLSGKINYNVK